MYLISHRNNVICNQTHQMHFRSAYWVTNQIMWGCPSLPSRHHNWIKCNAAWRGSNSSCWLPLSVTPRVIIRSFSNSCNHCRFISGRQLCSFNSIHRTPLGHRSILMLRSCYQLIIVAIHRRQGGRKAESEGDDIRVGEGGGGGELPGSILEVTIDALPPTLPLILVLTSQRK